jgi:hypothetical protein
MKMSKPKSLGVPEAYWEIEVRDKNGKLLERKRVESHSWLRQFIAMLKGEFATRHGTTTGNANVSVSDESGTGRTYPFHLDTQTPTYNMNLSTLGDVGDVTQGIVVGSSDTPNTITTYALGGKIAHGSGSGQLVYNAETVEDVTNPSGNDLQFRLTRTFTNNSGSAVVVKEIGLLIKKRDSGNVSRSFLAVRDVLASPSSIPDGATMTLRYIVKITVS